MNKKSEQALTGFCEFFFETGTEGSLWAFQDKKYISADVQYSYEGLHILKDGDQLTVYNPKDKTKVVWSGTISLKRYPVFTQSVFNQWIHSDQQGVSREQWAEWFIKAYPAKLISRQK